MPQARVEDSSGESLLICTLLRAVRGVKCALELSLVARSEASLVSQWVVVFLSLCVKIRRHVRRQTPHKGEVTFHSCDVEKRRSRQKHNLSAIWQVSQIDRSAGLMLHDIILSGSMLHICYTANVTVLRCKIFCRDIRHFRICATRKVVAVVGAGVNSKNGHRQERLMTRLCDEGGCKGNEGCRLLLFGVKIGDWQRSSPHF